MPWGAGASPPRAEFPIQLVGRLPHQLCLLPHQVCSLPIGGELSKREGVLFHWWSFSSKRNDRLQLFYTDTHHLTSPSMPNMNIKTITLLDICLKRCFIKFSFHFEGVLLAVRGCTSMFRGCSRTLKTPNSPPLSLPHQFSTDLEFSDFELVKATLIYVIIPDFKDSRHQNDRFSPCSVNQYQFLPHQLCQRSSTHDRHNIWKWKGR